MSTLHYLQTDELLPGDTVLHGSSMLIVDNIQLDDVADAYWIDLRCVSGNFDNYTGPIRSDVTAVWRVLDAAR